MVPSNHSNFQYCDSNNEIFFIVKLSLLILFASFLVSVLCFFFDGSLSKVIALPTIAIAQNLDPQGIKLGVLIHTTKILLLPSKCEIIFVTL